MPTRLIVGLVGLAAVATGLATTIRSDTSSAATSVTASCPGAAAGSVTGIVFPTLRVNGSRVSRRMPLTRRDRLETDRNGQVQFCLKRKTTRCDTRRGSKVQIEPTASVVLRFEAGRTYCSTASGGTAIFDVARGGVQLRVGDPVFGVTVEPRRTVVKVVLGAISVRARGRTVVVGPGQQTSVPNGRPPQPPTPAVLAPDERTTSRELGEGLPAPDLGRPTPSNSAALRHLYDRGFLMVTRPSGAGRVGAGAGGAGQPSDPDRAFERDFFSQLARAWGLRFQIVENEGSLERFLGPLESRTGDLAVLPSSMAAGVRGYAVVPLSSTPAGGSGSWVVVLRADAGLLSSLGDYLAAALTTGRYADAYRKAYGVAPPYTSLRELLFPTDAEAATAPTRTVVFEPVVGGRLASGVSVVQRTSGECFAASARDPRRNAWRCTGGDPCFSGLAGRVVCPRLPLGSGRVVELTLTTPLPLPQANAGAAATSGDPWVVETTDGRTCEFLYGATFGVGDQRVNYSCTRRGGSPGGAGLLAGSPYRGDRPWTILELARGASPQNPGQPTVVGIAEAHW